MFIFVLATQTPQFCVIIGSSNCSQMFEANSLDFHMLKESCKRWFEGGWLVILDRTSGKLNFNRGWEDYKDGFGEPHDEHWIGNEKLHKLTNNHTYKLMLYFDENPNPPTSCEFFHVASEKDHFALKLSLCKGPAAHALSYSDGAMFLAYDNDQTGEENCAKQYGGGFWYKHCSKVNFTTSRKGNEFMVSYLTENGTLVEKHAVKMMIKPTDKRKFLKSNTGQQVERCNDVATYELFFNVGCFENKVVLLDQSSFRHQV